ncbi:hypothetical protein GCM10027051_36740 [Niabella terrae]
MNNAIQQFNFNHEITALHKYYFDIYGLLHFKQFVGSHTVQQLLYETQLVRDYLTGAGITRAKGIPLGFDNQIGSPGTVSEPSEAQATTDILQRFLSTERVQLLAGLLGPGQPEDNDLLKDQLRIYLHWNNSAEDSSRQTGYRQHPGAYQTETGYRTLLTLGLHLEEAKEEDQLQVFTGSHLQHPFRLWLRKKFSNGRSPRGIRQLKPQAGDLTIHDPRLWHKLVASKAASAQPGHQVLYFQLALPEELAVRTRSVNDLLQKLLGWIPATRRRIEAPAPLQGYHPSL